MTYPFKGGPMGFDFSQNIKLFDSLNLHSDMFRRLRR